MPDTFQRLTPQARHALQRASDLSRQRNQSVITPEHVLLGLLQTPGNNALSVLAGLEVDLQRLTHRLESHLSPAPAFAAAPGQVFVDTGSALSEDTRASLTEALYEARESGLQDVDGHLLLFGILRRPATTAAQILLEQNVTLERARQVAVPGERIDPPAPPAPPPTIRDLPRTVSPIFLGLVALTLAAGLVSYLDGPPARIGLFVFVTGGWLVSLSLHEFGHALIAFLGGDRSVVAKGYLTLDPLKYTHKWLSILFPLLILAMGGIGLPGGAVYINPAAIRSRWMRSLTSAAGPIATGLFACVLLLPFVLRLAARDGHLVFWSGMAMLAFLQLSALFFNLLPIPGLDGFGILEPFLPDRLLRLTYSIRPFTFLILFVVFFNDNPVRDLFWQTLGVAIWVAGLEPRLITSGLDLYRFWVP